MSQDTQGSSTPQEAGEDMCCEICGKGLKNIITFLKHMNTLHKFEPRNVANTNKNLTRCENCPKYCYGEHGLKVHMNSVHKDLLSQNNSDLPIDDSDDEDDLDKEVPAAHKYMLPYLHTQRHRQTD